MFAHLSLASARNCVMNLLARSSWLHQLVPPTIRPLSLDFMASVASAM